MFGYSVNTPSEMRGRTRCDRTRIVHRGEAGAVARLDCATARWFCDNRTRHLNMHDRGRRNARIGLG
ncbi:hypothetical protein F8237_08150 [Bradyrhizobium betae]|uniref:Uncharacterized protein n=1 Tax=Bradyrhizobium betae TaxID=244734 RepID=A0A5P6P1W2_9BRAD|nr:hypothetical protein F8237_08150 [Bradyrhizobium betae]